VKVVGVLRLFNGKCSIDHIGRSMALQRLEKLEEILLHRPFCHDIEYDCESFNIQSSIMVFSRDAISSESYTY
jgi:hypothetical protein